MAFEQQRPNSGSIFPNDRKTEESHADRTGQVYLECPHCGKTWSSWINGWLKSKDGKPLKTKDGKPYMSLSFRPKQDRQEQRGDSRGGGGQQQRSGASGGNRYAESSRGGDDRGDRQSNQSERNWERDDPDSIPF